MNSRIPAWMHEMRVAYFPSFGRRRRHLVGGPAWDSAVLSTSL